MDYHGIFHFFCNAEQMYSAGTKVTLVSGLAMNVQNFVFMLDNQQLEVKSNQENKISVSFIMPDHDVSLSVVSETENDAGLLIANYYECTRTSENFSSYELVVKSSSDTARIIIEVFENEDNVRQFSKYLVDSEILNHCYDVCEKYQTDQWSNQKNLTSLDGMQCIYKYLYKGKMIRVTTDEMIENGMDFFNRVKHVMQNSMNTSSRLIDE